MHRSGVRILRGRINGVHIDGVCVCYYCAGLTFFSPIQQNLTLVVWCYPIDCLVGSHPSLLLVSQA